MVQAGDAIICAWIASEDTEEAIAEASACAISCGVRMQNELGHFDIGLGTDQQLESKITVTAGKLRLMHVGQTAKRREFVPAGEPFEDMKEFAPLTKAGRVVLSDFVARICEGSVNIVREHEVWCAESMKGEVKHKPLEVPLLSELDLDLLFRYCPPLIREMGADGELWGSEIRTVAVLFANLRLSKDMQGENLVNLAQDAFHSMLLALNAFDGALRQFLVEDKGLTLIGVWGLPFQSHHDDAARAAQAAKQMRVSLMERHSFDVGIGIAFGEAFCGSVGAPTRCEYSVTGRTVNLAARMMQQAEDSILTDSGTKNGCHNMQIGLSFLYRGLTNVKGFNYPVSTFQLVDNEDGQYRQNLRRMNVFASNIVYRQAELEQLTSTAKEVVQLGHSKLVLLTGAVYLGKSQLLANMVDELRQHGFRTVVQEDASVASTTAPLRGFQSTLENFFRMPGFFQRQEAGLTDVKTSIERISRVLEEMDTLSRDRAYQSIVQPADECAWVPEGCSFKDLAPVVARMLNMEVEENEMSKQIAQDTSASTFMKAVARNALRIMAEKGPVAIAIDNVSSMDPLSWEMLRKACEIDENLFIVVGLTEDNTRINQRAASRFERDRALSSKVTRIRLESLNREAIRGLICRRLQSKIVPRVFVDFAERLSEGSPVFCVEVVDKLFQLGIIEISDENDEVVVDAAALAMGVDQQVLPPTLAGAVRQNLDRVSSQAQLAAKACAVLGSEFDEEGASRLLDERIDVEVYRALRELQDASLIELMAGEEDNGVERSRPRRSSTVSMHENRQWQFRTATVHHCIYSTIPLELRRELHSEAAEYIERSATESGKNPMTDDRLVVVLAHHFEQGGQYARAFPLFRQAVERALDQGNYWDVTLHANSALQIAEKHMEGQLKDVANIAISLAEALYLLDEYERAEPWIEYVHTKLQGDIEPNSAETRKESAARTLSKLWCCFRADVSGSQRNSQASGAGSTSADHQEQLANGDKRPEHSNILTEAVVRQAKYMLIAGRIGRAHAALWHQAKLLKPEGNLAVLLTHCEEALSSLTCESTGQRKPTPWYSFDRNADGVPQTNLEAFRHLVLALAAWAAGDFQSALGLLESASLLAEGDKVLAGRVEAELKVVRCLIDRQDERISRGNQEAIADSMESEALANMGDLYMMQGNAVVAIIKGDLDRGMKATERFERAFEEYKPSFASERRDLGYAFSAEARMYSQREPEEAIKDALGALATLEERDFVAGFQTGAVEVRFFVALIALIWGDADGALLANQ